MMMCYSLHHEDWMMMMILFFFASSCYCLDDLDHPTFVVQEARDPYVVPSCCRHSLCDGVLFLILKRLVKMMMYSDLIRA